jgi:metal-responsive CopG/Arc/MetJ family transcriptional regulator
MKTAISIPNDIFKTADRFARRKQLSRSALFAMAVSEFVARRNREDVTEQLDKVYGKQESALDRVLSEFQLASIPPEQW